MRGGDRPVQRHRGCRGRSRDPGAPRPSPAGARPGDGTARPPPRTCRRRPARDRGSGRPPGECGHSRAASRYCTAAPAKSRRAASAVPRLDRATGEPGTTATARVQSVTPSRQTAACRQLRTLHTTSTATSAPAAARPERNRLALPVAPGSPAEGDGAPRHERPAEARHVGVAIDGSAEPPERHDPGHRREEDQVGDPGSQGARPPAAHRDQHARDRRRRDGAQQDAGEHRLLSGRHRVDRAQDPDAHALPDVETGAVDGPGERDQGIPAGTREVPDLLAPREKAHGRRKRRRSRRTRPSPSRRRAPPVPTTPPGASRAGGADRRPGPPAPPGGPGPSRARGARRRRGRGTRRATPPAPSRSPARAPTPSRTRGPPG